MDGRFFHNEMLFPRSAEDAAFASLMLSPVVLKGAHESAQYQKFLLLARILCCIKWYFKIYFVIGG